MRIVWFVLLASVLSASSASARDFRSADIYSIEHPSVRAVRAMADDLWQRSGGRLSIDDVGEDSEFTESHTVSRLRIGTLDMARVNLGSVAKLVSEAIAPTLPAMFASDAHVRKVLDGPVGDQILTALGRVGLVGLCFYDGGARSFISTKTPIRTLSDLAGMRVRVWAHDPWSAMLAAMGAKPRMMALTQAHAALQTGVVDADDADPATFITGGLARVTKVYSLTEHRRSISIVVFSRSVWNTLAIEDQRLIREAAMASVDHFRKARASYETTAHESLRTAGVSLIEDVDRSSFAKATRMLRARYVTDPTALEIAAKIRAADTELAKD